MKRSASRITLCLILLILLPALGAAQEVSLTILHTNDTHSHLLPFSYPNVEPAGSPEAALKVRQNIGGIARRATLVKRLRDDLEPRGTTVWLVDAGDFSDGTPFSTEYHGKADAEAMNAAGYTFGTLGNHEFNIPLATLREVIAMFKFPILCANVTENATGKLLLPASEIRSLGPLKIGVFGLVTRESSSYPAAKDQLTIAGEIDTARRMADTLHRDAGIVILISHAGEQVDEQIAAAVPGIDVIVGGHSHTRLPVGELMWHSDELKPKEVNGTIIVQAHQWGGELGRLDLLFDKDDRGAWHVDRYHARLLPITSDIPEDQTVASIVARYWKPIAAHYAEIIGQAAADISERGDDLASYNLVADAVREAYGTEIEFENMGGVRAPLIKGNITRADLVDMDPFNNTVMTFKITGRQLKEILARSRPAVSGLHYRMEGGQLSEVTVGGQPVDDNRVYTGATNSYFAGSAMKGIEVKDTGKLRLDVVIEQIRKKGTVRPVYDSRRIIINP
jgi:5'-nucleotidase/UDP-sugar diphosphatase